MRSLLVGRLQQLRAEPMRYQGYASDKLSGLFPVLRKQLPR